jgi:tRNA (guanine37-N1)-methyltransferase
MVMLPEPWGRALDEIAPPEGPEQPRLIVPSPSGRRFAHADAARLAAAPWLVFACGRNEGIDARVLEDAAARMPVEELSLGDYVRCGGEVAALAIVEAVVRLLPGVLGNAESAVQDSFAAGARGLLEAPAYTRPALWRGRAVPEVLLSGDHGAIRAWREEQSRERTRRVRPDLLDVPEPEAADAPG